MVLKIPVKGVSCRHYTVEGFHQMGFGQPTLSFDVDDVEEDVPVAGRGEVGSAEPTMVVMEQIVLDQGHEQLATAGVQAGQTLRYL